MLTLSTFAKDSIDYAFSFKNQKLQPINYSKSFYAIIIQEQCPACTGVYSMMEKPVKSEHKIYLSAIYEPSKRWMGRHSKYTAKYDVYSTGNLIKEKEHYPKATPALYFWDAGLKKGSIQYGISPIAKILKD